jgi:hypothetical protein
MKMDAYSHATAPPPHHDQAAHGTIEIPGRFGVEHVWIVERDAGRMKGPRPGGDEHDICRQVAVAFSRCRSNCDGPVRIKSGPARHQFDAMAGEVFQYGLAHRPRYIDSPGAKQVDDSLGMEIDARAIDMAALKSRQVESGFPHGLGRDRACGHRSAECRCILHDGNALTEVGSLGSSLLASRSGSHHHHVEALFHRRRLPSSPLPVATIATTPAPTRQRHHGPQQIETSELGFHERLGGPLALAKQSGPSATGERPRSQVGKIQNATLHSGAPSLSRTLFCKRDLYKSSITHS